MYKLEPWTGRERQEGKAALSQNTLTSTHISPPRGSSCWNNESYTLAHAHTRTLHHSHHLTLICMLKHLKVILKVKRVIFTPLVAPNGIEKNNCFPNTPPNFMFVADACFEFNYLSSIFYLKIHFIHHNFRFYNVWIYTLLHSATKTMRAPCYHKLYFDLPSY